MRASRHSYVGVADRLVTGHDDGFLNVAGVLLTSRPGRGDLTLCEAQEDSVLSFIEPAVGEFTSTVARRTHVEPDRSVVA
jgi:hypothetical protein